MVVHDPRVYHDLDPRSCLQGQSHNSHITKISVRPITPHCHVGYRTYFTLLYRQDQCHGSLEQKIVSWADTFTGFTWTWILHTVVVHGPVFFLYIKLICKWTHNGISNLQKKKHIGTKFWGEIVSLKLRGKCKNLLNVFQSLPFLRYSCNYVGISYKMFVGVGMAWDKSTDTLSQI